MAFRKIEAGLVHADVDQFIGKTGTIFYDNDLGDFRISDGATPGGIALSFGGGTGGDYTLPTATTTVKGGVKIDGTTIAITNQVIRVGTVPYSSLSGTPTIPTNNNQLTNGAGFITSSALSTYALSSSVPTNNNQLTNGAAYITSSALTGLATETYVTNQGYITSSALTGLATETYVTTRGYITSAALSTYALTSAVPTNNNQLSNGAGYITSSSLTGLATETYVTTRGYITSAALSTYALTSSVPTDISQLTDTTNLLGTGGGGGTTYITNTVENPYSFSIAGDDSTLREISTGESIKFTGAGGIAITTDAEGNVTVTGTPVSLVGYATESYVTTQGYITSSALTGYALTTAIPTNNNQLTNGAGYITSGALTGLATETYVTTRGYITSSALIGLATESYVTSRGYITGLSYNDLSDKPNLAGTYTFNVAADDSTLREISSEETVKFVGAGGITTASDAEGKITITQGTTSSLVNGANTVSLGSDGVLTIPPNGLIIASTGPYGQQHEMRLGDGLMIGQDGGLANYKNVTWSLNGQNSDSGTQIRLPGQTDSDNGMSLLIQHQYVNSSIDIESLGNIWSFRSDGLLTFPDGTTQSTAPAITIAADDSTQRTIYLGEESIKFVGAGGITTASDAEGAITITGPSLAGLATETFVTTQGYITSSALTGLATETYVNQAVTNLVDGAPAMLDTLKELALSLNNDSNLAATLVTEINKKANIADLVLTIAGDDSTEKTISLGEGIRLQGTGSITITTDLEGKVTINGAAPDLSAYALTSAVPTNNNQLANGAGYITTALNANGTFSLPILSAAPANLQAGQIALANGTSWDPLDKAEGRLYTALYTGTGWIEIGGITENRVYGMILGG